MEVWRISGKAGSKGMKESRSCFQGHFKELDAGFLLIAAFPWQNITLLWYLFDLSPFEKFTTLFFQHQGAKWGKSQGCSWVMLPLYHGESNVAKGCPGAHSPLLGKEQHVGRSLETSSPSRNSTHCNPHSCRVHVSVCCLHWPCQPAACPGTVLVLSVELPQCPASH